MLLRKHLISDQLSNMKLFVGDFLFDVLLKVAYDFDMLALEICLVRLKLNDRFFLLGFDITVGA